VKREKANKQANKETNQHTNTKLISRSRTHTPHTHAYRKVCAHTNKNSHYELAADKT